MEFIPVPVYIESLDFDVFDLCLSLVCNASSVAWYANNVNLIQSHTPWGLYDLYRRALVPVLLLLSIS